jgi:peptidoglycan-associated lipoprotein
MTKKARWVGVIALCLAVTLASGGCKGRGGSGGFAGDDIGGVSGTDVMGGPLGPRPLDGAEYSSEFMPVYFGYDSSQIRPSERLKIEEVADHLRGNSSVGVIIEGHCDERGSREYNLALGERRALAVRAYLIGLGIDGSRIQSKSYGEEKPVAYGHDDESWSRNRRAEFVLFY